MDASSAEVINALKIALKSRGITYAEVAVKIGVSEKTIKRLFRDKDCSLSRLSEICDAINLSLYDLLDFAKRHTEPQVLLSERQQHFMQENKHHFFFLFFLIVGYTPEQIREHYNLSELSIFKYLRDLDRMGFIELGDNNRFRLLIEGKPLIQIHGPMKEILKELNTLFLGIVMDESTRATTNFDSTFRYMKEESLRELIQELIGVSEKYRKISHQDEAVLPREKLLPVKWVTMVSEYDICGRWPLEEHIEQQQSVLSKNKSPINSPTINRNLN